VIEGIVRQVLANRSSNGTIAEATLLDDTNRRLLAELQRDARLSLAELGRRVGLSSPAVSERLQRLEQHGVIRGYRAEIDPVALGYPLSAVIRIRPGPRQLVKLAEIAQATPEVVECHRITGEDCYLLRAHVRSVTHLEEVIDQFTPYGQTTTSIVQSSPVPLRGLPAEREPEPDPAPVPERV
jgi:Lrp/AsnC family transcriptional regulator, leucine-responsive regulatory protein